MKEQVIQLPNNFEVKEIKDGKIILVEKEKKLTYKNIAEKLFTDKSPFYINGTGEKVKLNKGDLYIVDGLNNCISKKQAEKLLAINKLMNAAKVLNNEWQPDWNDEYKEKWYIYAENNQVNISYTYRVQCIDVYFKSKELARQAIEILGEETIKLALCTDY